MTAWATPADVLAVTGQTVTQAVVDQAIVQIELQVGRLATTLTGLTGRDAYWIKLAVAYQAAYVASGGSLTDRISTLNIDGMLAVLKPVASEGPIDIHPNAARAMRRLTWMRMGSRRVDIEASLPRSRSGDFGDDYSETVEGGFWRDWRPL